MSLLVFKSERKQAYGVKDWQIQVGLSSLSRTDASNNLCSIFNSLLRVESSLLASEALADDFSVFRESEILSG